MQISTFRSYSIVGPVGSAQHTVKQDPLGWLALLPVVVIHRVVLVVG